MSHLLGIFHCIPEPGSGLLLAQIELNLVAIPQQTSEVQSLVDHNFLCGLLQGSTHVKTLKSCEIGALTSRHNKVG